MKFIITEKQFKWLRNNGLLLEQSSFFNYEDDEFLTKYNKIDDLEIRKLKPKSGNWVNFDSEFGDVWHKIIKTYEPNDFYGSVYYYTGIDSKSDKVKEDHTYYYNIRKISRKLPSNARVIFDETGAYSPKRGNMK